MGISGIGPSELLLILLVALLLFGTKRLRTLGGDLGEAIRSFREAMNEGRPEPRLSHAARAQASAAPNEAGTAVAPYEKGSARST